MGIVYAPFVSDKTLFGRIIYEFLQQKNQKSDQIVIVAIVVLAMVIPLVYSAFT